MIVMSFAAGGLMAAVAAAAPDAPYRRDVEKWRAKHEADYRKEYVGLAGLFSLNPGVNSAGSGSANAIVLPKRAPQVSGRFVLTGDRVRFEPQAGVTATMKGSAVTTPLDLKHDEEKDGPDVVQVGGLELWVHLSGDRRTIRMRDDQGEVARSFQGFHWFPIDEKYRVTAKFIKDTRPQDVHIPNQLGDDAVYKTEGVVEFTLAGQTVRLRPMTTRPNRFYFIFRDGTSGKETYGTARFLYADLRSDGTAVLDFNQAYNPPCSFNPFTTCPLPPAENRLKVRILAGEKDYAGHKSGL
ncbi:MAG: DUF1684 domain-containing protein [Acidobacteriota bacterium]